MNIINLLAIFVGAVIGTLLESLCEEFTGEPIFYWILLPFVWIACLIRDFILYPIMKPKSIIWSIKHHLNYFHMSREDLYELDDDAWNDFLRLFVEPDKRVSANRNRNWYLASKDGLSKEEAFYRCEIKPIKDLLIKGDKKDEN
jgi:hypothetical protein